MSDTQPAPPRLAQALLQMLVRPSDVESIPGDLLEEYREVRHPSLKQTGADVWYIKHVLSVLWRLIWPCVVAIVALRVFTFPLPSGSIPSLVPAPGVSLLDALILVWGGYYGSRRTSRISTGIVVAVATSSFSFMTFCVSALVVFPSLLRAPFEKPFIFVIMSILLAMSLGFGLAAGTIGAAAGRWLAPADVKRG